jgi:oxygen-independent coproporphyrinogen-3 oxidase
MNHTPTQQLEVDLELVRKYNVAGPRYTSYPPATHFTDSVNANTIENCIRTNNESTRDISLYYHLPFCYSLCWFCGCTTVITGNQNASDLYVKRLHQEMERIKPLTNPQRKVTQLHFGGGSPTFLAPDHMRRLGESIHQHYNLVEDIEAGVEIDPRRLVKDHITALREIGFNRASLGVQDNNPVVQKAVHRIQPFEQTKQAVDWAREAGFKSVNIDLIYGLPHQTPQSFEKTLEEVLTLRPDRFAIFNYAYVPWMKPAQKIIKEDLLPTAEMKLEILKLTIERLTSEGYVYIGMDHFALADDELAVAQREKTLQRNFQGYSTRGGTDIYAFGMSSISQTEEAYWQNAKELQDYYTAVENNQIPVSRGYLVTEDDRIRRDTIMRLMCDLSLSYADMSNRLGINFSSYFEKELSSLSDLAADNLLELHPDNLEVTNRGRLFIRNVAMRFDAHLPAENVRRYSKTV